MYIVGLSGGIGAGKTTVANFFFEKGIPIYNCDFFAKKLMNQNSFLKIQIKQIFGHCAYQLNSLNTKYIAKKVFSNPTNLKKLNKLVHPYLKEDFKKWSKNQSAFYCIKEAAILFESGAYKNCDLIISIIAPLKERIRRVEQRDHLKKKEIISRIRNQISDKEKMEKSDILIFNTENLDELKKKVEKIHDEIINKFKK